MPILFHICSAPRRVGDYEIKIKFAELVVSLPGELNSLFLFTVVGMKRPAATLVPGDNYFAAMLEKYI